jgi:hypothetical protein
MAYVVSHLTPSYGFKTDFYQAKNINMAAKEPIHNSFYSKNNQKLSRLVSLI